MSRKSKKKPSDSFSKTPPDHFRLVTAWMQVTKIHDTHTIQGTLSLRHWGFWTTEEEIMVRPAGIICPQLHVQQAGQEPDDYAIEIMQYWKQHLLGKRVKIVIARRRTGEFIRDSYNEWRDPRVLAFFHPTFFGVKREALNIKLVRRGWARYHNKSDWMVKEYHTQLQRAERWAKGRRLGVWHNYQNEVESERWDFWTGFLLGLLLGLVISALWFYQNGRF